MYGCGDGKLATTLGKPVSQGKKLKKIFWDNNPALKALIADLEAAYRKRGGWIKGLDGRMLFIRDERKLLNSLLQNAAAVVFKRWMIECRNALTLKGFNGICKQIIAYHDELQFEVYTRDSVVLDQISTIIREAAISAGKQLKLNVPIGADVKLGRDWSQCH